VGSFFCLHTFQKGWLEAPLTRHSKFSPRWLEEKKDFRTRVSSPGCDKLQGEEKKEILGRVRDKKIISVNQQVSKTGSQSRKFSLVFKIS